MIDILPDFRRRPPVLNRQSAHLPSLEPSRRVRNLQPSPTLSAAETVRNLLAKNIDVIRLDIGEPDFETPRQIKDAGIKAIESGFTHYTSARGIPELRDALVLNQREKGLEMTTSNCAFFPGSKMGLFAVLSLLVDQGGEVLIQDPVWPTYGSIIEYLGGTQIHVPSWDDDSPTDLRVESFESRISNRTKAVIINSPCNPTGAVVDNSQLEELVRICKAKKTVLLLDRIYSALTYDESRDGVPKFNVEAGNVVVVSGFSKEFAMTGWRLGYTIASKHITDLLVNFQDNTTTCAPSFVQKAGVVALSSDGGWRREMLDEYAVRRKAMVDGISKIPGWSCQPPAGAFYCFPRIQGSDSIAFAGALLDKKQVSTVAGAYFGPAGEGHLRLSYTTSKEKIVEGMQRIGELVSESPVN